MIRVAASSPKDFKYLWGVAPVISEAIVALESLVIPAVADNRGL